MSTYYRELKEPWTSIKVETLGDHTHITLWEHGGCVGTIVVREPERVLPQFFKEQPVLQVYNKPRARNHCLIRRINGGPKQKARFTGECYLMDDSNAIALQSELEEKWDYA